MALQEQSANMMLKSEKSLRKNEEKVRIFLIIPCVVCLAIFLLFSVLLLDHQNCDARRCEKVQKKRNDFATSTVTADPYANNKSHICVND